MGGCDRSQSRELCAEDFTVGMLISSGSELTSNFASSGNPAYALHDV
jgi:hypothetical protein